jgi:hypothetical protein
VSAGPLGGSPRAGVAVPSPTPYAGPTRHTLLFLEPGHFHAALTLRESRPRVHDRVVVYATPRPGDRRGDEVGEFLALVETFNRRAERPTRWRVDIRTSGDPVGRLLDERPGDVAILAGRNDRKMALVRRLHDAGIHVLVDKPWITRAGAIADVRHVLTGGARVMEMMTGRHAPASIVAERLVREPDVFGEFHGDDGTPAIRLTSVHHLEKVVNGAPLRRPPWFFDVRVQAMEWPTFPPISWTRPSASWPRPERRRATRSCAPCAAGPRRCRASCSRA